jgi:hypothetical protein
VKQLKNAGRRARVIGVAGDFRSVVATFVYSGLLDETFVIMYVCASNASSMLIAVVLIRCTVRALRNVVRVLRLLACC